MTSAAGDLPDFEKAIHALFAEDQPRFSRCMATWPKDVRAYANQLAFAGTDPATPQAGYIQGNPRDHAPTTK